jgi:hypothetical protein
MRIGLLYVGNEDDEVWGSAISTLYLAEAFERQGHTVWRASATHTTNWSEFTASASDLVVSEGVPEDRIPGDVWESAHRIIFWWLSSLHYDEESIGNTRFHAIATNSRSCSTALATHGVPAATIELAAPISSRPENAGSSYRSPCVFLGTCQNKTNEQLRLLLSPATEFGLDIWGCGWEESSYKESYRGPLPLKAIGALYRSAGCVLALTEERQKELGMCNNRIFEALACAAIVISDPFPWLMEQQLGKYVQFVTSESETRRVLQRVFWDEQFRLERRTIAHAGQAYVLDKHTYGHRADEFIRLYESVA